MGASTLPALANQRLAALEALGLQEGANPEEVRRAFRQKALLYHPDKNLHDPEGAAEQFRLLVRAYQRLANPSSDQAWEDLQPEHILTEEFLMEALSQQLPSFELMYIQQRMAAASQDGPGLSPLWGDDLTGHASDKVWRRIHAAMQRRRQRQTTGVVDRESRGCVASDTNASPWAQFWEFLTDLMARDDVPQRTTGDDASCARNYFRQANEEVQHQQSGSDEDTDGGFGAEMPEGGVLRLVHDEHRLERRRKYRAAVLPAATSQGGEATSSMPAEGQQHATGCSASLRAPLVSDGGRDALQPCHALDDVHKCQATPPSQFALHPQHSHSQGQAAMHTPSQPWTQHASITGTNGRPLCSILSDTPVLLPVPSHRPVTTTSASTPGGDLNSMQFIHSNSISNVGSHGAGNSICRSHVADGHMVAQGSSTQGVKELMEGEGPRRPRWLTLRNAWVWTRRILLIKAVLLLLSE